MKLKLTNTYDYCKTNRPKLTVVLIHGIASDSTTYNSALKFFKNDKKLDDIRFVTLDLLGAGKSLKSDELEYNYEEQIEALDNAITDLKNKAPLVLVGHSLGSFIVTRYTSLNPKKVYKLVLISPPIYTKKDFENPAFKTGMKTFEKVISLKDPHVTEEKSFINSMNNIVLDKRNYDVLAKLKTPTTLIYGNEDQLIASYNVPGLIKINENITAIKTHGRHGVTEDKYSKIASFLAKEINA